MAILLSAEGREEFEAANPLPYWNSALGAWDDGLGHYSYDDGATWGDVKQAPDFSDDYETGSYRLNTPALSGFSQQYGAKRIEDGLGHWWDSSIQGWRNNDGSVYDPLQSAPAPVSTAGALASLGESVPVDTSRAGFLDYDLGIDTNPPELRDPWSANAAAVPEDKGWFEQVTDTAGDLINIAGRSQPGGYLWEKLTGWDSGETYDKYNEYIGNPMAETGAQLTPLAITAAQYVPGISGAASLPGILGYDTEGHTEAGLRELGSALQQSGGNPLTFAETQNENFAERPWWQQAGAAALYDPSNAIPLNLGAKAVMASDFTDDIARAAGKADDVWKAVHAGEEGVGNIPMPRMVSAAGKQADEAGERTGVLLRPRGIEQLGDQNTVKGALQVQADLNRQIGSQTNRLMAEVEDSFRVLGPTFKDEAGHQYFKRIAPSAAEVADGMPGALATRVIERPAEYALTPVQKMAAEKIAAIEAKVADERALFGVPVNKLSLEEGEQYMHRSALQPTTGKQVAGETLAGGGGGTTKLAGVKDKHRIFNDPLEAVREGVVYKHPKEALRESIERNLKTAGDAHVKSLLTQFSQTAGDRVPEALRAQVTSAKNTVKRLEGRLLTAEKRAGINAGKGDSLAAMLERQSTGAGLALDAPSRDIRTVNAFIQRAQQRIAAVRQAGGKYAAEARTLDDMLVDAKLRMADLMPAWEQAKDAARTVPMGRATVPSEASTALIGHDFTKTDAARIKAFYTRGIRVGDNVLPTNIPGVKAVNKVMVPLRAIGDASATFNQLAMAGVSHPRRFAQNFVKVLGDSFSDANYSRYIATNADDAAAHGISILGKAGPQSEFQFGDWLSRLPVLKQTQKHFERFGNRMRIDGYNDLVKASEAAGKPLDDAGKEALARSLNRVTGVSNSRATDLEGILQFAPNFLRSHIETIGTAATRGGIEGSLARQYVRNWATLGMTAVIGAAYAQNRDLKEVLTPLDMKALERGEIKLNPNFATVRVGGQDISVFGAYDSLARLSVLGLDSMYRAGRDRDAMQLFDFVGYAASTKGSPAIQFLTDLIKGETFSGAHPLDKVEMLKRVLPFTASGAIEGYQRGQDAGTIAKDSALGFFGVKSNPMALGERLDKAAGGQAFWDLEDNQREAILAADPKLRSDLERSQAERLRDAQNKTTEQEKRTLAFEEADKIHGTAQLQQFDLDSKLARREITTTQWREDRKENNIASAAALDVAYKDVKWDDKDQTDVDRYYRILALNTNRITGDIDYDQVDKDIATAGLDMNYVKAKTNLRDTEMERVYRADVEKVAKSGYFDRQDDSWAKVQAAMAAKGYDMSAYPTYYDWVDAQTNEFVDTYKDRYTEELLRKEAPNYLADMPPAQGMEAYSEKWRNQWVSDNPEAAYLAWRWGYYNPKKEIAAWLDKQFKDYTPLPSN